MPSSSYFFYLSNRQISFILLFPFAKMISRALISTSLSPCSLHTANTPLASRICFWILLRSFKSFLFASSPNYFTNTTHKGTDNLFQFRYGYWEIPLLDIAIELLHLFWMQDLLVAQVLCQIFPLFRTVNIVSLGEFVHTFAKYL